MLRFSELSINFTFYQIMICRVFSTCSLNLYMLKISVVCHIIFLFIVYLLFPFFSLYFHTLSFTLYCALFNKLSNFFTFISYFIHFCSLIAQFFIYLSIFLFALYFSAPFTCIMYSLYFFANFVLFFIIFHLDFFLYFEFIIICCLYPMLVHCLRYFVKLSSI